MKVTFECGVGDIAETSLARYRSVRAIRRTELGFGVATALLLGAATGSRVGGWAGLAAGVASALLAFLVYRRAAHWLQRRLIRRTWRQHVGAERVQVAVELLPDGVHVRHGGYETSTPWAHVRPPSATARGLELRDAEGPLVVVPDHAFASAQDAAGFRRAVADAASEA